MNKVMAAYRDPSGYVYVLDADHGVKVGITAGTVEVRLEEIARATGLRPTLVRSWAVESKARAWEIEQAAHFLLREDRVVGEWFHCHPLEACEAVDRCVRTGVSVIGLQIAAGVAA